MDFFLVWHAIAGYWAGVDLDSPDLLKYKPRRATLNAPPGTGRGVGSLCCGEVSPNSDSSSGVLYSVSGISTIFDSLLVLIAM